MHETLEYFRVITRSTTSSDTQIKIKQSDSNHDNKTQKQLETMRTTLLSVSCYSFRAGTYCTAALPTKAILAGTRDLLALSQEERVRRNLR